MNTISVVQWMDFRFHSLLVLGATNLRKISIWILFHNNINEWWELKVELSESSISNRFVISYSFLIKFDHFRKPFKVEKILEGSLDSIPPPSPSVKIQIMSSNTCLRCKGKTLLGVVNKLLKTKNLLTSPSNVLPYYL